MHISLNIGGTAEKKKSLTYGTDFFVVQQQGKVNNINVCIMWYIGLKKIEQGKDSSDWDNDSNGTRL